MVAYASRVNRLIPIVLAGLLCGCVAERDVPRLQGWTATQTSDATVLHARLPLSPAYSHLVFRAYVGELAVSIDERRVYAFRDPASTDRLTMHVVDLPAGSAGRPIEVIVRHPPLHTTLLGDTRYLATTATLPFALERATTDPLRENTSDILLGFILVVVGAIAGAASLIRRRGDALALGAFGAFTLLYGARLVADSSLPYFLGFSGRSVAFIAATITYIIPIAAWSLPVRLMGEGWKSSLRWQVMAFLAFAPIGIASDVVTGTPASLEIVNNVLVIIGGVNILFNLLLAVSRGRRDLYIVLAGSFVLVLFTLNNNLSNLGLLPWEYDDEAPGFVIFVAALGFAATRAFVRGERESIAIANELQTAREIQQSILPRAMPELPGLRFHAGYAPATSVGGDMYSFLSAEGGAGVLVADVAGHGVPAALIASMVKIAVSSQARLADDPAALISELNTILRRDVRRAFVTATYLWFDLTQRRVTVCNAGHPAPLLYRDGTFIELGAAGVLLGRFADAKYTAIITDVLPGDRITAYTDGIPEARNARDEMFGEDRLHDLIRNGASAESVLAAVHTWRGDQDDADDLTIVIVDVE